MLAECTSKILKHSNWHEESKYYKQHLFPIGQSVIGKSNIPVTICRINGSGQEDAKYYIKHDIFGVQPVPRFMAHSLINQNRFTYWIGPYAFVNEFELTREGQYLIKMLEYPTLTPRAQQKVNDILNIFKYWVQVDTQMLDILKKRDRNNKGGAYAG